MGVALDKGQGLDLLSGKEAIVQTIQKPVIPIPS